MDLVTYLGTDTVMDGFTRISWIHCISCSCYTIDWTLILPQNIKTHFSHIKKNSQPICLGIMDIINIRIHPKNYTSNLISNSSIESIRIWYSSNRNRFFTSGTSRFCINFFIGLFVWKQVITIERCNIKMEFVALLHWSHLQWVDSDDTGLMCNKQFRPAIFKLPITDHCSYDVFRIDPSVWNSNPIPFQRKELLTWIHTYSNSNNPHFTPLLKWMYVSIKLRYSTIPVWFYNFRSSNWLKQKSFFNFGGTVACYNYKN